MKKNRWARTSEQLSILVWLYLASHRVSQSHFSRTDCNTTPWSSALSYTDNMKERCSALNTWTLVLRYFGWAPRQNQPVWLVGLTLPDFSGPISIARQSEQSSVRSGLSSGYSSVRSGLRSGQSWRNTSCPSLWRPSWRRTEGSTRRNQQWCQEKVILILIIVVSWYWGLELIDDISVSSSASHISVIQQREKLAESEQDKEDWPDSTTDHSETRDVGKQEVSVILSFTVS